MTLVDELVNLRLATWARYPEYRLDTEAAHAAVRDPIVEALDAAEEVRVLEGRAAVVISRLPSDFHGVAQRCRVELQPDDGAALDWAAQTLRELAPGFERTWVLRLEAVHAALLPHLEACGLAARMAHLHGNPAHALEGLRAGRLRELAGGFRIEPLTAAHIEAIMVLDQRMFRAQPELGFVSPFIPLTAEVQERIDTIVRGALTAAVEQGTGFVVMHGDRVLGHTGAKVVPNDPLLVSSAGLAIALDPSIHGRGIGTRLYEKLLLRMVELGVRVMAGKTANPIVRHLGERMGRPLRAFQVEPAGPRA